MLKFLYHLGAMWVWGALTVHFDETGAGTYLVVLSAVFSAMNAYLAIDAAITARNRA